MYDYKVEGSAYRAERARWLQLFNAAALAASGGDGGLEALRDYLQQNANFASRVREELDAYNRAVLSQREREIAKSRERQAILDHDHVLTKAEQKGLECAATVYRSRSIRGYKCMNLPVVRRRWAGGGDSVHEALLCGVHRRVQGQFGWAF